jgi:hypothetical protein
MLFVMALVHGLVYLSLIPPWQGADEPLHFEYGRLLAEYWRPLRPGDGLPEVRQAILDSMYQFRSGDFLRFGNRRPTFAEYEGVFFYSKDYVLTRFSLAYIPYALAVWPFRSDSIAVQLYIMRLVSVIWGASVVVLAFETALLVAPRSPGFAVGTAWFVLFLPQHAHVTASVSDGNLAELTASITIYLLTKMMTAGLHWRQVVLSIVLALVSALTKATALFLIPLVTVIVLARAPERREHGLQIREWWKGLLALLLIAALGAALLSSYQMNFIWQKIGPNLDNLARLGRSLAALISDGRLSLALWATFRSFWVNLGWLAAPLPEPWYYALLALSGCAVLGWAFRLRQQSWWTEKSSLHGMIGLAACLPTAVTLLWFVVSPDGIRFQQGRYLFAGIVPIAMVLVGGWLSWGPPRRVLWLVAAGLVLLDAVTLLTLAIPFFYP